MSFTKFIQIVKTIIIITRIIRIIIIRIRIKARAGVTIIKGIINFTVIKAANFIMINLQKLYPIFIFIVLIFNCFNDCYYYFAFHSCFLN